MPSKRRVDWPLAPERRNLQAIFSARSSGLLRGVTVEAGAPLVGLWNALKMVGNIWNRRDR